MTTEKKFYRYELGIVNQYESFRFDCIEGWDTDEKAPDIEELLAACVEECANPDQFDYPIENKIWKVIEYTITENDDDDIEEETAWAWAYVTEILSDYTEDEDGNLIPIDGEWTWTQDDFGNWSRVYHDDEDEDEKEED